MVAGRSAQQSPEVTAVDAIYQALSPLDPDTRTRVLASAMSLLGMAAPFGVAPAPGRAAPGIPAPSPGSAGAERPLTVVELMQQKAPVTNPQKIALFAYYREKVEGVSRFSKNDLKAYFGRAREVPPGNYDRDFREAVKLGWIHDDGDDSYLTSKGLEVVEAGFAGKQRPRGSASVGAKRRGAKKRAKNVRASGRGKSKQRP
jgi:hypothetical protein